MSRAPESSDQPLLLVLVLLICSRHRTPALFKRYQPSSFRASPPLVSQRCICSAVPGVEHQTPAVHAPVFLLQPPHVINHVKWQKAQHCQDCEGDLMELKMGCFVLMQSILFHLGPACLLSLCPRTEKCLFWCQAPKSQGWVFFKQSPADNKTDVKFGRVFLVVKGLCL